jgi:hypothetical protein
MRSPFCASAKSNALSSYVCIASLHFLYVVLLTHVNNRALLPGAIADRFHSFGKLGEGCSTLCIMNYELNASKSIWEPHSYLRGDKQGRAKDDAYTVPSFCLHVFSQCLYNKSRSMSTVPFDNSPRLPQLFWWFKKYQSKYNLEQNGAYSHNISG